MIDKSRLKSIEAITPVTDDETEARLLQELKTPVSEKACLETLWELTFFYHCIQRIDVATTCVLLILDSTDEPEEQARCYRNLGVFAEHRREYEVAIQHYEKGVALRPRDKMEAYFLHNNMAYCLNLLGKHDEAEAMCHKAIEIDSTRHNAWKNLGLSLEAKGDLVGAAYSYVEATRNGPRDARAAMLLEQLLKANPGLQSKFPQVLVEKADCDETVTAALEEKTPMTHRCRTVEICRLKKIPNNGYWIFKDGVERPISEAAIKEVYSVQALVQLDHHPNIWVAILAEDLQAIPERHDDHAPNRSGSGLVPCLVLGGEFLKRLQMH